LEIHDAGGEAAYRAHASQIRTEQTRTLYQQLPLVLVSNIVMSAIVLGVLWSSEILVRMLWWALAMGLLVFARAGLWFAHHRANEISQQLRYWNIYYVIGAFLSGCTWAAASLLLYDPQSPTQLLLLTLVLAGTGAGALAAYSSYLPAFFLYFLPSTLPYMAMLFYEGTRVSVLFAGLMLLYMIVLSSYARTFHALLKESWRLRFANVSLVDALIVQKDEAERANAAKTRFLAAASHDLRQPLHALGLFVSALRKKIRKPDTREIVSNIDNSVTDLQGLFSVLLDISRLDAGVIQPEVTSVSVQELFDRLARDFSPAAVAKGLALRFVATRAVVVCDRALLDRIVRNLVSNAVRYTDSGGIVVGCRRHGQRLQIQVCDSGIGIAPAERGNVFQEFYQIGNPERDRNKGLGLGLAIVERLAALLKLPLALHSVPGRGSCFTIGIPRAAESSAAIPDEMPAPLIGRLRGALIVVIDDERAVRQGMQVLLADWGCDSVLAASGDDALAELAIRGRAPDVILADYRLREGRTGPEAIRAVQAAWGENIPAIIVTGDTAPERLREAQASGFRLLHKPLPPARLRAVLAHLLE